MDREKLEQAWLEHSEELQREEELRGLAEDHREELERARERQEVERKDARDRGADEAAGALLLIIGIVVALGVHLWLGIGIGTVGLLLLGRALRD